MNESWTIVFVSICFLSLGIISYWVLKSYAKKSFGNNWLRSWGNKFYLAQGVVFVSLMGTMLIVFLFKFTSISNMF